MTTRPYSSTVTAGDDILAVQYNNLRDDSFYHFTQTFENMHIYNSRLAAGFMGTDYYVYSIHGTRKIVRWYIWPGGIFPAPGAVSVDWLDLAATYKSYAKGLAVFGGYIYSWMQRTSDDVWVLVRIAESNGSVTEMTISGDAPDSDHNNLVTNDGTDLYILDKATTKLRKYSVSGTTATHVADITLSEAADYALLVDSTRGEIYFQANGAANMVKNTIAGVEIKKEMCLATATSGHHYLGYIRGLVYLNEQDGSGARTLRPFYY